MRNNYGCDLDSLTTGSRIGMMRSASGNLHYYINGVDQGMACSGLPPGTGRVGGGGCWGADAETNQPCVSPSEVYAVIDLYGQCVQVSITSASGPLDNSLCTSNVTEKSFPIQSPGGPSSVASRRVRGAAARGRLNTLCICSCGRGPSAPQ